MTTRFSEKHALEEVLQRNRCPKKRKSSVLLVTPISPNMRRSGATTKGQRAHYETTLELETKSILSGRPNDNKSISIQ